MVPISPQAEETSSESTLFFFIAISKGARLKEFRVALPQWERQVKREICREGKRITYFPREKMMHADRLINPLKSDPGSHMAGPNKSDANLFGISYSCMPGEAMSGTD